MGDINSSYWLNQIGESGQSPIDGLVYVDTYSAIDRPPEEAVLMEKARKYGATAVFFEAARMGRSSQAQAFIYVEQGLGDNEKFAQLHQKLWSWGGVPLVYRKLPGQVQLFRCAHGPDFIKKSGTLVCNPVRTLQLASEISRYDPWWDADQLRNGTLWDNTDVCKELLSAKKAAHKALISAVAELNETLNKQEILPKKLRRKLLILSLLIAYLEQRDVFGEGFFEQFLPGATEFFEILANGEALSKLLKALEERFNGHVFVISDSDREKLLSSNQLHRFSRLIEGREAAGGQLTLWKLYSFQDLPVELISHIYQLFVKEADSSVYTPPFLVRLMLEESLSWDRLDRIIDQNEVILDPSCGSGVFLVEAYKRLILHWRSRNNWQKPDEKVLKQLLMRVHGVDLEEGAIELAAFSLCLALCDALEPLAIRSSIKLFPRLAGVTLHHSCFFEAKEKGQLQLRVGALLGNPPFASKLSTAGAVRSYQNYGKRYGRLPDLQLGYLFLHEAMEMVVDGGILCLLQQYNFLYNLRSRSFRHQFIDRYDVREVLDFISVRGLFQKGAADTKVIVLIAEARTPPEDRRILHATFRRSGRIDAEQGFDIDYYDMHWIPRDLVLANDGIWRANLLGGGRSLSFADRLRSFKTLGQTANELGWDYGEGFIESAQGAKRPAPHIIGKPRIDSYALTEWGIDTNAIQVATNECYESPRSEKRFTPPMLLVREHMDIPHAIWTKSYLTYTQQLVGFCAPTEDTQKLTEISNWISDNKKALQAYLALVSPRLFIQKATALQADDIFSIPLPENRSLDISGNEQIIIDDVVDYYRDLIRLGEDSEAMLQSGHQMLPCYSQVITKQINTIYQSNPLQVLEPQSWPGVICQPFVFGQGQVDWSGKDELKNKLNSLLSSKQGQGLNVTRITRIYDGNFIFIVKPDRLRYWLRSIALRDADETLADLRMQGF